MCGLFLLMKEDLLKYLSGFVTVERLKAFQDVINLRSRYITVALEDIYQPHNASAVLRSCDCFGIQDVHIIENKNEYTLNPDVALGSSKWINLIKYNKTENNTPETIRQLRDQGYRIIATSPHESKSVNLEDINPENGKMAIFFGTEMRGLSESMQSEADEFLKIPMVGFTESLNISVSAAIIIHNLTSRIRQSDISWQLEKNEKNEILQNWLLTSIKNSDMIVKKFLE